jgi:hypothetical protein
MKTYIFFPVLIAAVTLITSCKDDDNGTPRQITQTYTYSQNIRGSEGVKGELPLPDLNLADVVETDIADNLTNAQLQLAQSYLEVSGLNLIESSDTAAIVLKDFTVMVGNRQGVNLGNFSTNAQGINELASDVQHSTNQIVNLIQNIFTDLTSGNQRAEITVSFMPNVDITSSDNVQLQIHFRGIYHYVTYD